MYPAAESGRDVEGLGRRFGDNAVIRDEGRTQNRCRLPPHRKFPGSPIDPKFLFGVEAGKIASLEIV